MDVSAAEVVLGIVLLMCAVGAVYGARWVSRRSDEQMERTRAALRARHAVPERPPVPTKQVVVPQPPRGGDATRQLSPAESAAVLPSRTEPAAAPAPQGKPAAASTSQGKPATAPLSRSESAGSLSRAESAGLRPVGGPAVPSVSGAAGEGLPSDDDPDSSGRHRVPEELMRAATYSLSPDRVARAKVPGPRPRRGQDRLTDRRS